MFEVNDIPPIDSWTLQDLIAENVQHEEFLFFRINHGDDLDYFGPDSYTRCYECFCTGLPGAVYRAAFRRTGKQMADVSALRQERYAQTVGGKRSCGGTAQSIIRISLFSGRRARRAVADLLPGADVSVFPAREIHCV